MFEEKERIFSRDNEGLYTVRSRSWLWLNKFEREFKKPVNLGLGSLALRVIFLMWGLATLNALEDIRLISGELIQCYPKNINSIVLKIDDASYSIEAAENPQFADWKERIFQNIQVGDSVEIAVLKTVDGSEYIVRLRHDGIEYFNNIAIWERYKTDADYMLITGAIFVILGLSSQIRKIAGKRSGQK